MPLNPVDHQCIARAEQLNAGCHSASLDRVRLAAELERVSPGFHDAVMSGRPHLFSDSMVFVSGESVRRMKALIAAVERVLALPAYRAHVLQWAPPVTAARALQCPVLASGVFLGYDFHLASAGAWPQLIEINTNAGGGMLNAVLARAQQACCDEVSALLPGALGGDTPEHLFVDMFRAEWRAWQGHRRRTASADFSAPQPAVEALPALTTVAIVDQSPAEQYLYPEFVLFQRMFEEAGIHSLICDPEAFELHDGSLWSGTTRIDLVYNRLTDFALDEPSSAALRQAWLTDAAMVTPHPVAHALYADKRNLVALCDDALLASWGVNELDRRILAAAIPRTVQVFPQHADDLWARRKQLFFKPAAGYGSKAAYRGDKITKRVFDEVLGGNYIAQALVPPSSRLLSVEGAPTELKLDLRNYVYAAQVQLISARLWQGQTTNFRTRGGGFAPVLEVPCTDAAAAR